MAGVGTGRPVRILGIVRQLGLRCLYDGGVSAARRSDLTIGVISRRSTPPDNAIANLGPAGAAGASLLGVS